MHDVLVNFSYRSMYWILYGNVFSADHTTCEVEASANKGGNVNRLLSLTPESLFAIFAVEL